MIEFTIGEKKHEVGPLPFARLKKLWPLVKDQMKRQPDGKITMTVDDMVDAGFKAVETTCQVLSVILIKTYPELTAEAIEEAILPNEVEIAAGKIQDLLVESGLIQRGPQMPSVDQAASAANPSTATGTQSSQSLSLTEPKEAAGG